MSRPQFSRRHPAPSAAEIKALREAAGLTMGAVARIVEISASSWESYEYGRHVMPAPIYKLAKILLGPRIQRLRKKKAAAKKAVIDLGQVSENSSSDKSISYFPTDPDWVCL